MRKLAIVFVGLFALCATALYAANEKPVNVSQLPVAAQKIIKQHFSDSKVIFAKEETELLLLKEYKVVFADGNHIEFDGDGNWEEINCKFSSVPAALVPAKIADYVKVNFPGVKIVQIEKDKKEYEVKLSNRAELTFDLNFNLINVDM